MSLINQPTKINFSPSLLSFTEQLEAFIRSNINHYCVHCVTVKSVQPITSQLYYQIWPRLEPFLHTDGLYHLLLITTKIPLSPYEGQVQYYIMSVKSLVLSAWHIPNWLQVQTLVSLTTTGLSFSGLSSKGQILELLESWFLLS